VVIKECKHQHVVLDICACHHWKGKQTLPTGNMWHLTGEPQRKSRRISSKRSWSLHIKDNREVHIQAQSNICSTAQSEGYICACHHWKGKQTLPTGNMWHLTGFRFCSIISNTWRLQMRAVSIRFSMSSCIIYLYALFIFILENLLWHLNIDIWKRLIFFIFVHSQGIVTGK
jgi:hypothetical protein